MLTRSVSSLAVLAASGLLTGPCSSVFAQSQALPQAGRVVAGHVQMANPNANQLLIFQQSDRAVIDWSRFDIGQGASVQIKQPSAQSALLNRVYSSDPVMLMGQLQANGQVFITNPAGLIVGPKASVQASAFVASTASPDAKAFAEAKDPLALFKAATLREKAGAQGTIIQAGHLRATSSEEPGTVALLAKEVKLQGLIEATGLERRGGSIWLVGEKVALHPASKLDVSSAQSTGGLIRIEAKDITLSDTRLDASGATAGGTIHVGGAWQGQGDMPQANQVTMDDRSEIRANATLKGKGGEIVLWSDIHNPQSITQARGVIEAQGGAQGGDGGAIETSGAKLIVDGIRVNAQAGPRSDGLRTSDGLRYNNGQWLLDPSYGYSVIGAAEALAISNALNAGTDVTNMVTGTMSFTGNPSIQKTSGGDVTLTLKATERVKLQDVSVSSSQGKLNLILWANSDGANQYGVSLNSNTSVNTNGGHVWIGGGSGSISWNNLTVGNGYSAGSGAVNANGHGVDLVGSVITQGGSFRVVGQSTASGYNDIRFGYNNAFTLNTGSGDVDLVGNRIGYANASSIASTGSFSMTPLGAAFTNSLTWNGAMSGVDFVGGESFGGLTIKNIRGMSQIVLGKPGNTSNMNIKADLNAGGPVQIHGGQVNLVAKINAPGQTVLLNGSTRIQAETTTAAISASQLVLVGGGWVDLTMSPNSVQSLAVGSAATPMGYVKFQNASALSLNQASVAGQSASGVQSTSTIDVSTSTGSLELQAPVITSNTGSAAITLHAAKSANALTSTGGDLVLSAGGQLQMGAGARASLYSGSIAGSTALANFVGAGTGRFRYGSDETTTNYSNALGSGLYLIYRERPSITLTGTSQTITYGDSFTASGSAQGLLNGDQAQFGLQSPQYASSGELKVLGTAYSVVASNSSALQALGYHLGSHQFGQLTVLPKALSLSIPNTTKVYDGTTAIQVGGSASLSQQLAGDDVQLGLGSVTAYVDPNVGSQKAVTYSGFTLTGADQANYSLPAQVQSSASITPKTLTLSGFSASDKVYDGTRAASIQQGSLSGLIGNESLQVQVSGLFDQKEVGTRQVTATLSLQDGTNGGQAANYSLAQSSLTLSATINPKTVSLLGLSALDKTYDGSTNASVQISSLQGLVSGESLSVQTNAQFSNKDVGARSVSASFALANGSASAGLQAGFASNYVLSNPQASLSANITPKAISVTDTTITDKVYDGSDAATLTQANLSGLIGQERLNLTSTARFASANAAQQAVLVQHQLGDGSQGGLASNYTLSNATEQVTASITPKTISVVGTTVGDKTYDGSRDARVIAGRLDGLVGAEQLVLASQANFTDKDAGLKQVTVQHQLGNSSQGLASNYQLSNAQEIIAASIIPKSIAVQGTSVASKIYDGTQTAQAQGATLSGLIAGEQLQWSASTTLSGKDVGQHTATVYHHLNDGINGLAKNYQLSNPTSYHSTTITPKSLRVFGAWASDKVYDGQTIAQVQGARLEGLVGDEYLTLLTRASFASKQAQAQTVTASFALADGKTSESTGLPGQQNASSLSQANGLIQPSGTPGLASNYQLDNPHLSLRARIIPKPLDLVGSGVADKVYDGTTNANLLQLGHSVGVIAGDDVSVSSQGANFADKHVGEAKRVVLTGVSLAGADAANYNMPSQFELQASIKARELSLDIPKTSKIYDGQTSIRLGGPVGLNNLVSGDQIVLGTGAVTGYVTPDVGEQKRVTYVGFELSGADAKNYVLPAQPVSSANITPKAISLSSAFAESKIYDGTDQVSLQLGSLQGLIGEEQLKVIARANFPSKDAGKQSISAQFLLADDAQGLGKASNYSLINPQASLQAEIYPKTLTVIGGSISDKVYDGHDAAPFHAGSLSGLIGNESLKLNAQAHYASNQAGIHAATISYSLSDGSDGSLASNYRLASVSFTQAASITPRPLSVIGSMVADKVYDGTNSASLSSLGTLQGLVEGESLQLQASAHFDHQDTGLRSALISYQLLDARADATRMRSGATTATAPVGVASNYQLREAQQSVVARITPKEVWIEGASVASKTYDGTTDAVLNPGIIKGLIGDEQLSLQGFARFDHANAGTQHASARFLLRDSVSAKGALSLASNYFLKTPSLALQADIKPQTVFITGAQVLDKVYDGTSTVTIKGGKLEGVLAGESIHWQASAAFSSAAVGNHAVSLSYELLDGKNLASNYKLAQARSAMQASITPKWLDVAGLTSADKTYDGTNQAQLTGQAKLLSPVERGRSSASLSPVAGDDVTLSGDIIATFNSAQVSEAREVSFAGLKLSGADAGNYRLMPLATVAQRILPKLVSVEIPQATKIYDGLLSVELPKTTNLNQVVAGDELSFKVSLIKGEVLGESGSKVGQHAVIYRGFELDGPKASNYRIDAIQLGAINITPRPLSVTTGLVQAKIYDGLDTASWQSAPSLQGVLSGDKVSLNTTLSFETKDAGLTKPMRYSASLSGADAFNYALVSSQAPIGQILPRDLKVDISAQSKWYDGSSQGQFTASSQALSGDEVQAQVNVRFDNPLPSSMRGLMVDSISLTGRDAANYRPVIGNLVGAAIIEIPRLRDQVGRIDSIAPHLGTAPIQQAEIASLQVNASYSHPQQLALLKPSRVKLIDPMVWGEAAVHVDFSVLNASTRVFDQHSSVDAGITTKSQQGLR